MTAQEARRAEFMRRIANPSKSAKSIRLPSLERLLEIDAAAEAAARAVAGPQLRQGRLFTDEATIDTIDGVDAADGRQGTGMGMKYPPPYDARPSCPRTYFFPDF